MPFSQFQPAHVKACFLGSNLTVPVSDGKINLGTWQGVWLCEHRDRAGSRKVLVTVNGAMKEGMGGPAAAAQGAARHSGGGGGGGGRNAGAAAPQTPTSPVPSNSS